MKWCVQQTGKFLLAMVVIGLVVIRCQDPCGMTNNGKYVLKEGQGCDCAETCGFYCDKKTDTCLCNCLPGNWCTSHTPRCGWGKEASTEAKTEIHTEPISESRKEPRFPEKEVSVEPIVESADREERLVESVRSEEVRLPDEGPLPERERTLEEFSPREEVVLEQDAAAESSVEALPEFFVEQEPVAPEASREEPTPEPQPELECRPSQTRPCYTGPATTRNIGICKDGMQSCVNSRWSVCQGDTTPTTESCNGHDDNCDGTVDEFCVITVAGDGKCRRDSSSGDWLDCYKDGPAAAAQFRDPDGIAVDKKGNLFIVDTSNHCIRKLDTNGNVSTVAGNGIQGHKDGPAASAQFNWPLDIEIDSSGNFFIADTANNRIRKLDTNGNVSTVAGDGRYGYKDGPAASAQFFYSDGITVDNSGNIFIADTDNDRIRKLDTNGNVSTVAGNGIRGYKDGPATSAQFDSPRGIAVDKNGNIFIADTFNNRIRKLDTNGNVSTVAGDGNGGYKDGFGVSSQLNTPRRIAVDSIGNIFIADTVNNRIRKLDTNGNVSTVAGDGNGGYKDGPVASAQFNSPRGIAIDSSGNLFIVDTQSYRIRKIIMK